MIKVFTVAAAVAFVGGAVVVSAQNSTPSYDIYRTSDGRQMRSEVRAIEGTDCLERVNRRGRQMWVLPPSGQDPSVCEPDSATPAPPSVPGSTTTAPASTTTTTTTTTTTAPTSTAATTSTSAPSDPGHSMQIPGIEPSRGTGRSSNDVLRRAGGGSGYFSGTGEVRLTCGVSHHAYDDPIVAPGQPGASHLHTFFGNAGTDANSTYESLRNEPQGSTCAGGSVNKSSYWFPSLIDGASNSVVEPTLTYVYYKTGYWGQDGRDVQDIPNGLRMVAGDASAERPQTEWALNWKCSQHSGDGVPLQTIRSATHIPTCGQNQLLSATVLFPQCWNGTDLDSPDHQSHMAHPNFQGQCPSSHPVLLPQITMNATFNMTAAGSDDLYLSNDMMTPEGAPPGQGLHADFFEAWDPASRTGFVENCLNTRTDCGTRQLGDGYTLLGP